MNFYVYLNNFNINIYYELILKKSKKLSLILFASSVGVSSISFSSSLEYAFSVVSRFNSFMFSFELKCKRILCNAQHKLTIRAALYGA